MKKLMIWTIIILLIIQFIDLNVPQKITTNPKEELKAPKEVMQILNKSCADCHSNYVKYPWYDRIAPISWYVQLHVKNGRKVFNYDKWNSYSKEKQLRVLDRIPKAIKIRMPLPSYLWLHPEAKLSKKEKEILKKWAENLHSNLK
jgi:hypothetical protein